MTAYLLNAGGYLGLFLLSVFAESIFFGATEPAVVGLWSAGFNVSLIIGIATIGNMIGAYLNYFIGTLGEEYLLKKRRRISEKWLRKAESYFEKRGPWILFFSWLPFVGDPLTVVGGLLKYDLRKFTVYAFAGKVFRYVGLYGLYVLVI